MTKNAALDNSNGLLVTLTRASTRMTSEMATVKCTGPMAVVIKESGSKVFSMAMAE